MSPITPEFCLRLGWAVGKVFARRNGGENCHILIGKDTRISGYMLESVLESGLAAAGANVSLMGPMPTPAVAYLTRTLRADAGIVVSASHNPYYDNGIKFFDGDGNKLADEVELEIELSWMRRCSVWSLRIWAGQRGLMMPQVATSNSAKPALVGVFVSPVSRSCWIVPMVRLITSPLSVSRNLAPALI